MNKQHEDETIILKVYNDVVEAGAAKSKLEAAGITVVTIDENVLGMNPLGGIELKIFARDEKEARKIISD